MHARCAWRCRGVSRRSPTLDTTLGGTQSRDGRFEPSDLAVNMAVCEHGRFEPCDLAVNMAVNRAVNSLHLELHGEEPRETAWRETIDVGLQSRLGCAGRCAGRIVLIAHRGCEGGPGIDVCAALNER